MIELKDISIRHDVNDRTGEHDFTATVLLTAKRRVLEGALSEVVDPDMVMTHIKEGLVHQIMHMVYGDFREPLHKLLCIARLVEPKYSETAEIERIKIQIERLL